MELFIYIMEIFVFIVIALVGCYIFYRLDKKVIVVMGNL